MRKILWLLLVGPRDHHSPCLDIKKKKLLPFEWSHLGSNMGNSNFLKMSKILMIVIYKNCKFSRSNLLSTANAGCSVGQTTWFLVLSPQKYNIQFSLSELFNRVFFCVLVILFVSITLNNLGIKALWWERGILLLLSVNQTFETSTIVIIMIIIVIITTF